jgi:hypothetical protein
MVTRYLGNVNVEKHRLPTLPYYIYLPSGMKRRNILPDCSKISGIAEIRPKSHRSGTAPRGYHLFPLLGRILKLLKLIDFSEHIHLLILVQQRQFVLKQERPGFPSPSRDPTP